MLKRNWKSTVLSLPILVLAGTAFAQQPQAADPIKNLTPVTAPETTAVLPTGGGLVFSGSWDRWFRAFDDATGKVLWQTRLNNVISAFPISYSVNGKQYVAVAVGGGSTMSKALATLTPEIQNPDGGSVLWVFALPN